jgi:hypothetical protein
METKAEGRKKDEERAVRRIASQIARYVEYVWPKLERRGGTPDDPMDRDAKGGSNPPMGDHAFDVIDANRLPSRYFRFFLEVLEQGKGKTTNGVWHSEVLKAVRYDAGNLTQWRAGQTEEHREMMQAFEETVRTAAKGVVFAHGPDIASQVYVVVNPEDEQQRARTRSAQKIDTLYTRRLMVEQLEEVEEETGYKGLMAMEILSDRKKREGKDWSVRKLREARTVVNRERRENAAREGEGAA